jgi:hypothetical protein
VGNKIGLFVNGNQYDHCASAEEAAAKVHDRDTGFNEWDNAKTVHAPKNLTERDQY